MSIELDRDGDVAVITMNRPERLNALDAQHYSDLAGAWIEVRDDRSIRAAVVTGAGERSFSVGADLKSFIPEVPELGELWLTQREQLLNRGLEVWKPMIAAVNGYCLGGGMTLLLATDLRVAGDARHVRPARGQARHRCRPTAARSGSSTSCRSRSRWRCCSPATRSTPRRRCELGLVNRVVAAESASGDARSDYARRIAANAPLAVRAAKELAYRSRDLDLAAGLRLEQVDGADRPRQRRRARRGSGVRREARAEFHRHLKGARGSLFWASAASCSK